MKSPPSFDGLRGYAGPVRTTVPTTAHTRCVQCQARLTDQDRARKGEFCLACLDMRGAVARLAAAQADMRRRWLEQHPVCAHCGRGLPPVWVARGVVAHLQVDGACADGPGRTLDGTGAATWTGGETHGE